MNPALSVNAPPEMAAALTWMTNHHDFRAGTSCADSVYSKVTATPSVSSTAPITHTPNQRRSVRLAAIKYTRATAIAAPRENSYMLPSGKRSAARPRKTNPAISSPVASQLSDRAMLPVRRPGSSAGAGSTAAAPAAPTSTFCLAAIGTRRAANDAAKANRASVYTSIEA